MDKANDDDLLEKAFEDMDNKLNLTADEKDGSYIIYILLYIIYKHIQTY
jgi:hypothetical protein